MTLTKTTLFSLVGLSALALVSTLYFADQKPAETPFDPATLSGVQTGTHPWPPETARLLERLEMIGLPALTIEGTRVHSHQHLEFFIRGEHYTLPSEIGIGDFDAFISPLHTHENDGLIHVESPTVETFTLGQFFDVWGVLFTDTQLGGYQNNGEERLRIYVNGQKIANNFRDIILEPRQQITITFGVKAQEPNPIPASFEFLPGY